VIVIYTSPGCASCRKVKKWLKDRNLDFIEKNIFSFVLNEVEIKHLLMRSENGTEDLISKRSKIIQENKINLDEMSVNEIVKFIQDNPSVLRRPIIVSAKNFLIGYDEEEIDVFIPNELRHLAESNCNEDCPSYPDCGAYRKDVNEVL